MLANLFIIDFHFFVTTSVLSTTLSKNFFSEKKLLKKQTNMATPKKSVSKKSVKKGSTNKKAGLTFPVGRVGRMLRKGRFSKRVSAGAAVFLAATLEYLTAETLELASKTVAKGSKRITPRALTLAIRHDADLGSLLQNVTISRGGVTGVAVAAKAAKKAKKAKKSKKSSKSTPKA